MFEVEATEARAPLGGEGAPAGTHKAPGLGQVCEPLFYGVALFSHAPSENGVWVTLGVQTRAPEGSVAPAPPRTSTSASRGHPHAPDGSFQYSSDSHSGQQTVTSGNQQPGFSPEQGVTDCPLAVSTWPGLGAISQSNTKCCCEGFRRLTEVQSLFATL